MPGTLYAIAIELRSNNFYYVLDGHENTLHRQNQRGGQFKHRARQARQDNPHRPSAILSCMYCGVNYQQVSNGEQCWLCNSTCFDASAVSICQHNTRVIDTRLTPEWCGREILTTNMFRYVHMRSTAKSFQIWLRSTSSTIKVR
jgi:hypothetical protein